MYSIWYIMINQQEGKVEFSNVECSILECGVNYIMKRFMICLHTFEDDVFVWKE